MAKTSKTDRERRSKSASSAVDLTQAGSVPASSGAGRKAPAAKASKAKAGSKKAANGVKGGQRKKRLQPSDDDIRLRAYFIAERRLQLSIPGDAAHDWIEARRQLLAEATDSRK